MKKNRIIRYLIILVGVPVLLVLGITLWKDRSYNLISMLIAVSACIPFFMTFEKHQANTRRMVLVAVMTAISVAGRFIFAPVPFFKPVTAVTILTAIYFGAEAGFLTGAFTAVVSNMFFGQGPWTPFQMFSWGIIGFLAGILSARGWLDRKAPLAAYGVFAGILFSFLMDLWSVLNYQEGFQISRYQAALISAIPVTAVYCVSNVIFLLVLKEPVGRRLTRIRKKYGI